MKQLAIVLSALLLASCVSVPRDAGLTDVQQAVSMRANQTVDWTADDARAQAMLQDDLTADEAVAIAIANHPRLQATLAELGVARAELIEASTISNPLFEFEIRYPGEPKHPYELRLAQSIIDLIQLPRRRAAGRAMFDAAQMRVSSEILRFGADVRAAYFDVIAASQNVAMSRTIFESAKTAAEVAMKQHAAGNITDLDLENEQALYEQAKLDLAREERQLLLAREALIRGMGLRDANVEWRVPESFPDLPAAELDQAQLEQLAAARRLDIAIARRDVEAAQQRVPLSRLAALEETEVDIHFEREPDGAHTVGPGIEMPIPIFNTGRAGRTRAEAELLRARHSLDALLTESASQLRSARVALAESRARVEYYRDVLLPRRRRILELTKIEHNAMLAGVFQLLQAKQNEAQAQRDYVEAQREYWTARVDLDRAINGITPDTSFTPATTQQSGMPAATRRGDH